MDEPVIWVLAVLIMIAAFLYSSVGHGGASGYLAVMALMGLAPEVMKPAALCLNVLVATISTVQFWRAGYFSWALFWPFALASIPAAFLGGRVAPEGSWYKPAVGVVLVLSAVRLLVASFARAESQVRPVPLPAALGTGAGIGLLAGLTGTGGGIFLSPVLLIARWADTKQTAAVSGAFILVNSLAGLMGIVTRTGQIPGPVPLWGAAAVIGGLGGSYLGSKRLEGRSLRRLLAVVLLIAGGKLILM